MVDGVCDHCGLRIARCRACGADILWARSGNGKPWPLDLELTTVAVVEVHNIENYEQDQKRYSWNPGMWKTVSGHVSHMATCPNWPTEKGLEAVA